MKKLINLLCQTLWYLAIAGALAFMVIASIDAEVARRDRELGKDPSGCIFQSNCWKSSDRPILKIK